MNYRRHYDRVCNRLGIGTEENSQEETDAAHEFWVGLVECAKKGGRDSDRYWTAVLMEEALIWRVISFRLMRHAGEGPLLVGKSERAPTAMDKMNPAIDGLGKAQERLKKVMKELMERLKPEEEGGPVSLPGLMKPIIEQAGDVLDDAIEYERNKQAAERQRDESARHSVAADDIRSD